MTPYRSKPPDECSGSETARLARAILGAGRRAAGAAQVLTAALMPVVGPPIRALGGELGLDFLKVEIIRNPSLSRAAQAAMNISQPAGNI
jgi:hypothetical protein